MRFHSPVHRFQPITNRCAGGTLEDGGGVFAGGALFGFVVPLGLVVPFGFALFGFVVPFGLVPLGFDSFGLFGFVLFGYAPFGVVPEPFPFGLVVLGFVPFGLLPLGDCVLLGDVLGDVLPFGLLPGVDAPGCELPGCEVPGWAFPAPGALLCANIIPPPNNKIGINAVFPFIVHLDFSGFRRSGGPQLFSKVSMRHGKADIGSGLYSLRIDPVLAVKTLRGASVFCLVSYGFVPTEAPSLSQVLLGGSRSIPYPPGS